MARLQGPRSPTTAQLGASASPASAPASAASPSPRPVPAPQASPASSTRTCTPSPSPAPAASSDPERRARLSHGYSSSYQTSHWPPLTGEPVPTACATARPWPPRRRRHAVLRSSRSRRCRRSKCVRRPANL
ncbi:hypothetical protein FOCC_FOCC012297 [Frankliniella occidentalis]|nr:hypothetical protein FOCC_FOCC012297 [Frankliniella occidentalis]